MEFLGVSKKIRSFFFLFPVGVSKGVSCFCYVVLLMVSRKLVAWFLKKEVRFLLTFDDNKGAKNIWHWKQTRRKLKTTPENLFLFYFARNAQKSQKAIVWPKTNWREREREHAQWKMLAIQSARTRKWGKKKSENLCLLFSNSRKGFQYFEDELQDAKGFTGMVMNKREVARAWFWTPLWKQSRFSACLFFLFATARRPYLLGP